MKVSEAAPFLSAWVEELGSEPATVRNALRRLAWPGATVHAVSRVLRETVELRRLGFAVTAARDDESEAAEWSVERVEVEGAHVAPFSFAPARDDLLGPEWGAFVRDFERVVRGGR